MKSLWLTPLINWLIARGKAGYVIPHSSSARTRWMCLTKRPLFSFFWSNKPAWRCSGWCARKPAGQHHKARQTIPADIGHFSPKRTTFAHQLVLWRFSDRSKTVCPKINCNSCSWVFHHIQIRFRTFKIVLFHWILRGASNKSGPEF